MKVSKILILGNSITRHAPKAEIGWFSDCGMAAGSLEKDYVHLLLEYLTPINNGKEPESIIKNIAAFEREYASFDIAATLDAFKNFHPDLALLCIGENIPAPQNSKDEKSLLSSLKNLVSLLRKNGNPAIFVRSCFWADPKKDNLLRLLCADTGAHFIDISCLHENEENFARSERSFTNVDVGNHPGDRGMSAIALAIGKAIAEQA